MGHRSADAGHESTSPERVAEFVRSLTSVMQADDVTELDLSFGDITIRLRRQHHDLATMPEVRLELLPAASEPAEAEHGHVVTAPMVGTFYLSPTPSSPPFVRPGDDVVAGQTIGIIEAMKIMNEIAVDRAGTIQAFLVENAQPVEYGSPLLRLVESRGLR